MLVGGLFATLSANAQLFWGHDADEYLRSNGMDSAAAFVPPLSTFPSVNPGLRQVKYRVGTCPRRPRVICKCDDDGSLESLIGKGEDLSNSRPTFVDFVGRQFLKSDGNANEQDESQSKSQKGEGHPGKMPWLPDWGPRKKPDVVKPPNESGSSDGTPSGNSSSHLSRNMSSPDAEDSSRKSKVKQRFNPLELLSRALSGPERPQNNKRDDDAAPSRQRSKTEESPERIGLGEVWKRVVDVIVPNRDKADAAKQTDGQSGADERRRSMDSGDAPSISYKDTENTRNPEEGREVDKTSKKGIEELYKPPPPAPADAPRGIMGVVSTLFSQLKAKKNTGELAELGEASQESSLLENKDSENLRDEELDGGEGVPEFSNAELVSGDAAQDAAKDDETSKGLSRDEQSGKLTSPQARVRAKGGVTANSFADISSVPQRDLASIRMIFGSETFFATETLSPPGGLIFRGNLRGEPCATLEKLEKRLEDRLGDKYTLCLAEGEEDLRPVVVVVPTARDRRPPSPRQRFFSSAIAGLTLSTCFARANQANWYVEEFRAAFGGGVGPSLKSARGGVLGYAATRVMLLYPVATMALSIIAVVLVSQIVQRYVARRHQTRIGLPYLIPSFQLGAFGSIVQVASPTPTRAALFDIALAGASTLVLLSVGLLLIGLWLSTQAGSLVMPVPISTLSSSLILGWLTKALAGGGRLHVHGGLSLVGLHPLAALGANCVFIAALNLLPIRQLDGGRIVSAIYGRKTAILASRVTIFFLLLASARSSYLFVFLALVIFGPWSLDRPAKNELTEPNAARTWIGYLFLLFMLSVLLPYPSHIPFKLD